MASVWRSCTFSRLFRRNNSIILNNSTDFGRILHPESISALKNKEYSSYSRSPFVFKIKDRYKYEIVKNPPQWSYVSRLLPNVTIPEVTPKESYPSGWVPPRDEAKDLPYYFPRTKNHQLPIYLELSLRGARKISMIKKIEGDIWLLNDEIKAHLHEKNKKYIETRVHEIACFIEVKGDYVDQLRKWAYSKGF